MIDLEFLNNASEDELRKIPRVGSKTVAQILKHRPYRTLKDLNKLRSMNKTILSRLGLSGAVEKDKPLWRELDGVMYPEKHFARCTTTGKIDLFWRIPRQTRSWDLNPVD